MIFYGLCDLPWWGFITVLFVLTHITVMGVTIYLHRCQAHRALNLHPAISHFFRFWLWLTTGMVTKEWVAVHRKHHAYCETPDDPHSPQILGLPMLMWRGTELYRKEAANAETVARFCQGTPNDRMESFYRHYSRSGIILMLIIDLLLFGVPGIAMWALQMAWIPFFAAGLVNGVGHYWGYRNFECEDQARNISPWGIFAGGEELHNNHHTYPTSAKLSLKWWEFDLGWCYIRLFEMLGLAQVKRIPPEPHSDTNKSVVDMETLKAIFINRYQLMARYSKDVLLPVYQQEKEKFKGQVLKRVKALLVREPSLLDPQAKLSLQQLLTESKTVQVVYQFKMRLQALWHQTTGKENDLLEALQKWCVEAEATGIAALKEFVIYLKSISLKTA